jgi:hypothetical protein
VIRISELSVIGRRACAALAVGSACLHLLMLGHAANVVMAALLAVMIVGCLYCARELWRDGTDRAWVVVALMNLAMVAIHLPAPGHHHGAASVVPALTAPDLMTAATAAAFLEALAAAAVLCGKSRGRLAQLSGTPGH